MMPQTYEEILNKIYWDLNREKATEDDMERFRNLMDEVLRRQ